MYFADQIRQIEINYRERPVEEDEEGRRGRRFSTDEKRKERLTFKGQGEACSNTEMRGMKELA